MSAVDPMVQVRNLCQVLGHPNWMARPRSWVWRRPDGMAQGFGPAWQDEPGRANLLWLSLNLVRPPADYDASKNDLYMAVLLQGRNSRLAGEPLFDQAALLSLRDFVALLERTPPSNGTQLEQMYPLLRMLAAERLRDADT